MSPVSSGLVKADSASTVNILTVEFLVLSGSSRNFQNCMMQGKERMRHKDELRAFLGNHRTVLMLDSGFSFLYTPGRLSMYI